jgi:NAD(P)-dependent dehydrogenase (short-subunit alcohol dehydrogenase family)
MDSPTVFISGAAAGIGRATALAFARRGYRVGAYDIDAAGLATLRDEITGRGGDVVVGSLDVTDAAEWARQLEAFTAPSRRLDILVNNAGVLSSGRFEEIPLEVQRRMIDINFYGTLAGLHAAFDYLRNTPGAQVVNLCSASAIYGQPELAVYSATKFGVRGITEALELEWSRYGIRVMAMWPLFVATAMVDGMETGSTKSLGVHLTPNDVAEAIYSATHPGRSWPPRVHYPVGRQTKVLAALSQVSPNWVQRLMNKTVSRS